MVDPLCANCYFWHRTYYVVLCAVTGCLACVVFCVLLRLARLSLVSTRLPLERMALVCFFYLMLYCGATVGCLALLVLCF